MKGRCLMFVLSVAHGSRRRGSHGVAPWLAVALLVTVYVAGAQRLPDNFDPVRAEREGRELVDQLLARVPAHDYTNTGTLRIRPRGGAVQEWPVRFVLRVERDRWLSLYEAEVDSTNRVDALTILSQVNEPNRYFRGHPREPDSLKPLTPEEAATVAFAGSDFTAADLGLEFLRWPVQRLLKTEMRRSQSCHVLESVHTHAPGEAYSRVVSWLDMDTGGIVFAEAFDADRKRVKEFMPKSFKKVEGQWQLKEMEIEDFRNRSRTAIVFDVAVE